MGAGSLQAMQQRPGQVCRRALSAQDKGKLRFSGLIARMPAKRRDRDFFVPSPSASVPGERPITDLALCGQPWLTLFAQMAELTKRT